MSAQQQQKKDQHLTTPSKTALGAPGITKTPPTPNKTPEQLKTDLQYLKDHRICEKLEFIVKHLLNNQPEDPILSVCNVLRQGNQNRSSIMNTAGGGGTATGGGGLNNSSNNGASATAARNNSSSANGKHGQSSSGLRANTSGALPPLSNSAGSSAVQSPIEPTPPGGFEAANNNSKTAQHHRHNNGTINRAAPSAAADGHRAAAGSSSNGNINSNNSGGLATSGRVGTPGSAAGSVGPGGLSRRDSFGMMSTGTGGLQRDESARSETSVFSITSVDMSEFLAEFRASHFSLFGNAPHELITKQDLADIVDRVALPLPDVRMLVDLFNELVDETTGLVPFEAFLARMNFKIQGKYPMDIIRGIYFSLLSHPGGTGTGTTGSISAGGQQQKLTSYTTYGSSTDLASTSGVGLPPAAAASAGSTNNNAKSSSPSAQDIGSPSSLSTAGGASTSGSPPAVGARVTSAGSTKTLDQSAQIASSSSNNPAATSTAAEGITRQQCLEEGLWKGLGIRITHNDFERVMKQLGIPEHDEGFVFHVSDFTRIVLSITGQQRDPLEMSEGI